MIIRCRELLRRSVILQDREVQEQAVAKYSVELLKTHCCVSEVAGNVEYMNLHQLMHPDTINIF